MYDKILDALRRGANDEALTIARVAAADAPNDPRAQRLLATALRANGQMQAGLAALDRAVLLAPDDADLHFQRAGLLIGEHKLDEAQAALANSVGIDPNQFGAYILQAQLALGRGDLDEAERLHRMAARVLPEHPWLQAIEGTVALRRGDSEGALAILSRAAEQAPDDAQVRYALGFAYLQQGHLAFAEQAFRVVVEQTPQAHALRGLIADLQLRQEHPDAALETLQPLLDNPANATPALKRMAGELELALGRYERALPLLRDALAAQPQDRRTLGALIEAWRRSGDIDDARNTLAAALAESPNSADLWQARLAFEQAGSDDARAVIDHWLAAMPDHVPALEALLSLHDLRGDSAQGDALAQRIVELEPGRTSGELRVLDRLLQQDSAAAVARVEGLIAQATDEQARQSLRLWLGYVQDRAGRPADAIATWSAVNAANVARRLPLTEPSAGVTAWPDAAPMQEGRPPVAYLWGPPGSGVEHVAVVIAAAGYPLRDDRFGAQPPNDPLQNPDTIQALAKGGLMPQALLEQWRAALPARGINDGIVIDWLPWWDNMLLKMLRPLQPEAIVLVALRDPRDMLLEWIAFGAPAPFAVASPMAAAVWMTRLLHQVADLDSHNLQPHKLIRVDAAHDDIDAFAAEIGGGLGLDEIMAPPARILQPRHFPPGHWRAYAEALAEPFALLTPVARQLGYPER